MAFFIVVFLVQVNRDELISRINRSTPNRFTLDMAFVQSIGIYVLAIVGALLVEIPFFSSIFWPLFEPFMQLLH